MPCSVKCYDYLEIWKDDAIMETFPRRMPILRLLLKYYLCTLAGFVPKTRNNFPQAVFQVISNSFPCIIDWKTAFIIQ